MGDAFVAGVGTTRFGRGNATIADLVHEAVADAVADADVHATDVSAVFIGCAGAGALFLACGTLVSDLALAAVDPRAAETRADRA